MKNKILTFFKSNYSWIICFLLILLFIFTAHSVLNKEVLKIDTTIYQFLHQFSSTFVTNFFKVVTHLAGGYILVGICIIVFLAIKKKKFFYIISLNLINTILCNQGLKLLFTRERPPELAVISESGYSFPSGHSMAAMSFYGFLIYITFRSNLSSKYKWMISVLLSVLILLIGISRIYLGVHYASDVIAGFCISVSYLIIFTKMIKNYLWEVKPNE